MSFLIQLINSLTDEERKGIKKQLSLGRKSGEKPVLLALYNAIEKSKTADDKTLAQIINKKHTASHKEIKAIRVHKTYLKDKIYAYLKHNNESDFRKFAEDLELISVLINKKFAKEAIKQINSFKVRIAPTTFNFLLFQCNYYHAIALQQDTLDNNYLDGVIDLYEDNIRLTNRLNITARMGTFVAHSNKLQMGGMVTAGSNTLAEMERLEELYLGNLDFDSLTDFQKRSYYFARIGLLRIKGKFQEAQQCAEKAWEMTRSFTGFHPQFKLATLADVLQCCQDSSDWTGLKKYLEEFEEHISVHFKNDFVFEPTAKHYRLVLLMNEENVDKISKAVALLDQYYLDHQDMLNITFRRMLQLDLMKGFWIIKNHFKALTYIDLLTEWDKHASIYHRLKETVLLFGLLIRLERWFETRNVDHLLDLSDCVENFNKRLLTTEKQRDMKGNEDKADLALERFFIQLIKRLEKRNASKRAQLQLLKDAEPLLEQLLKTDDLYARQVQTDFDLRKWLRDLIKTFKLSSAPIPTS